MRTSLLERVLLTRGTTLPIFPTMAGARICVCHRARLVGECAARALGLLPNCSACWLEPAKIVCGEREWLEDAFDLLLLDAETPRGELTAVVSQMRSRYPDGKLLFLVPERMAGDLITLTQLGSQGCVRENGSLDDLWAAIQQVLTGQPYFPAEFANALFLQLNGCDAGEPWGRFLQGAQLTSREQDVLRLIAWENLSNKQIARRLHVSLYTVKNHVHNIIDKLDVNDRHGAAQLAQRRNLISAS
jgi:DNA-binding NarL/FixJ family response regulator